MSLPEFIMVKHRRLYRVKCRTCNIDRGFQRNRESDKNCRSCDNTIKNLGKIHSIESKIKRSAWNQGITVNEFQGFLKNKEERNRHHFAKINRTIFERDNFICNCCQKYGGRLNAHHLESFDINENLRLEKTNIVTLCEQCHLDFHKEYGRGENTRQQFIEYKEKMNECR